MSEKLKKAAAAYVDAEMVKRDRILDDPTRDRTILFMVGFATGPDVEAYYLRPDDVAGPVEPIKS